MKKLIFLLFLTLILNSCLKKENGIDYEFNAIESDDEFLTEIGKVNVNGNSFVYQPLKSENEDSDNQDYNYTLEFKNGNTKLFGVNCDLKEEFSVNQFGEQTFELYTVNPIGFDNEQKVIISKKLGVLGRKPRFNTITFILQKVGETELNAETKKIFFEKLNE